MPIGRTWRHHSLSSTIAASPSPCRLHTSLALAVLLLGVWRSVRWSIVHGRRFGPLSAELARSERAPLRGHRHERDDLSLKGRPEPHAALRSASGAGCPCWRSSPACSPTPALALSSSSSSPPPPSASPLRSSASRRALLREPSIPSPPPLFRCAVGNTLCANQHT